jgi:hypothetical protein
MLHHHLGYMTIVEVLNEIVSALLRITEWRSDMKGDLFLTRKNQQALTIGSYLSHLKARTIVLSLN